MISWQDIKITGTDWMHCWGFLDSSLRFYTYLCHSGSSCSPCCAPLKSHLSPGPPGPHQESVPARRDPTAARCPVGLKSNA